MFVTIQIDIHIKRTQNVHIQHLITEKHHKNKTLKTKINTPKKGFTVFQIYIRCVVSKLYTG